MRKILFLILSLCLISTSAFAIYSPDFSATAKIGGTGIGTEAQAPACAAAINGWIYTSTNATDGNDCTYASGTSTATNQCVCITTTWTDLDAT